MLLNKKNFLKDGFCKGKFNSKTFLFLNKLTSELELGLKKKTKIKKINFYNFHNFDFNRNEIIKIQNNLKHIIAKSNNFKLLIKNFTEEIFFILGPDISYQTNPWIRIARPYSYEDNIGFHKDTLYGQNPLIPSVHFPLVNTDIDSSIGFVKKSFRKNEKKLIFKKETFKKSLKNSIENKNGIPYKPKSILVKNLKKFPIKFGEYVVFVPSLIHGQEINKSKSTRFSIDIRFINSFYLQLIGNKSRLHFKQICNSDLKKLEEIYINANK